MGGKPRPDFHTSRTSRINQSRSHPDDAAHRVQVRDLLRYAWQASGLPGKHWSFKSNRRDDWMASSVQRWAEQSHLKVEFVFEGLEQYIPEELKVAPAGETLTEQRIRAKRTVTAIREARGIPTLEMDRLLGQSYTSHHNWENARRTDFKLSSIQRITRVLGGEFRVRLEHKHNPAMLRRLVK